MFEVCAAGCGRGEGLSEESAADAVAAVSTQTMNAAGTLLVGMTCDDGANCTINDVCTSLGVCAGTPKTCAQDAFTCTTDACNESTGQCTNTVSSGCLINNVCVGAGTPRSGFPCQVCNFTQTKTAWSNQTLNTPCTDNQFCTQNDACNGTGVCTGSARSCTDSVSCTTDSCNEGADRCDHATSPTGGCVIGGLCYAFHAPNPSNPCQWCDSTITTADWVNAPSGGNCSDKLQCTTNDQCDGNGECVGVQIDCSMGNACDRGSHRLKGQPSCEHDLIRGTCCIGTHVSRQCWRRGRETHVFGIW